MCNFVAFLISDQIDLSYTKPIPRHALVMVWDNNNPLTRFFGFYAETRNNGLHRALFINSFLEIDSITWDNIEVIPRNPEGLYEGPFEWANKAIKKLKELD